MYAQKYSYPEGTACYHAISTDKKNEKNQVTPFTIFRDG